MTLKRKEMVNKRKIFVSCGEMSGDMHLSYIIEEMKKQDKELEFCGIVGDKSIKAGAIEVNHIKNNDIMGFVEVVKKYSYFKKKAFEYLENIRNNEIDTVIFVDFGGFNLKFFELLKKNLPEIRTIYYIPPKVWAWGKKRIKKLSAFDDVIVIFPFEKKYFDSKKSETGLDVKYFGNPLVDKYNFSNMLGDKVLLLPGSRKQEIKKFIPEILKLIKNEKMIKEKFIIKFADKSHLKYIEDINLKEIKNLEITFENIDKLRENCKYAIATSGTVTFELALTGLPVITVYKTSFVNAFIGRNILKIKYISLTNLISGEEIFPELLQENFSEENLLSECKKMEKSKVEIMHKLKKERAKLGNSGVLDKVAKYIIQKIKL